jgi:hypothetical protein
MATETTYTQAQYDGASRALTQTLAELRERTDALARAEEANRSLRYTDGLLRGQVATLEQLRDTYAEQLDEARAMLTECNADGYGWKPKAEDALALVREIVPVIEREVNYADDDDPALQTQRDWLTRARTLLGETDGAS